MLFKFLHLPVSHFANFALPFRARFMHVPSVYMYQYLKRQGILKDVSGL